MQVTDEMVKHAVEAYRKDTGAEDWQLLGWIEPAIRAALEAVLSAEATSFRCEGCGSSWDDARLAEEREKRPELISCCPERKLEPVWYQNIKGMLRGVSFTEEMKMACLREFEAFYKSTLSAQVQDVAGWQPIETAPKDGTIILLFGGAYHPFPGYWELRRFNPTRPWVSVVNESRLYEHVPTHWMPLPAAPAKQEE